MFGSEADINYATFPILLISLVQITGDLTRDPACCRRDLRIQRGLGELSSSGLEWHHGTQVKGRSIIDLFYPCRHGFQAILSIVVQSATRKQTIGFVYKPMEFSG